MYGNEFIRCKHPNYCITSQMQGIGGGGEPERTCLYTCCVSVLVIVRVVVDTTT